MPGKKKALPAVVVSAKREEASPDWEAGLKVGSSEWITAAEKHDCDRLKLQYYGLSREQWDELQKSTTGVVDTSLRDEALARVVKFDSQPEVVKQREDAIRNGPPPLKVESKPATPANPEGAPYMLYAGIAVAVAGVVYFFYTR